MRGRAGAVVLAAASAIYLWEARKFETGFIADPIGPRAFPLGIGLLTLLVSVVLFFVRDQAPRLDLDFPALLRAGALSVSLVVYAFALPTLGFVLATTLEMAALVGLFRGRLVHGLVGGLLLSVGFYFVFGYLMSVPLPLGSFFEAR